MSNVQQGMSKHEAVRLWALVVGHLASVSSYSGPPKNESEHVCWDVLASCDLAINFSLAVFVTRHAGDAASDIAASLAIADVVFVIKS